MNDYIVRATAGNAQIRAWLRRQESITEQVRLRQQRWEDSLQVE